MKKILFILFGVLLSTYVQAQKIILDKSTESYRGISCSRVKITEAQAELELTTSLGYMDMFQQGVKMWSLNFTTFSEFPKRFPEGARLLIKLQDDSLLEFKNMYESNGWTHYKRGIRATNELTYKMTEDDVKSLLKGVKKLRFETSIDKIDIELPTDIMGEVIRNSYNLIIEAISKPNNFEEGF